MPLTMAAMQQPVRIKGITGKDETRRFLASLGFVEGQSVTIVSQMGGNLILSVMDTRVALGKAMASRIMV